MSSPSMDDVLAAIANKKAEGAKVMHAISTLTESMCATKDEVDGIIVRRPSPNETVIAGIDSRHRLRELWIKPGACISLSPTDLAKEIMSAITEASGEADKRREAITIPQLDVDF